MLEPLPLEITPGRYIGETYPCFIVAEIGQNHQGDLNLAKELILAARRCGADCVKFQKSSLEHKFTKKALLRKYESPNSFGETYGDHKRHLEFSESDYFELVDYARELGIPLTASAMDEVSVDFLQRLKVPFIKIGSGDFTNPIVLSRAGELTDIPLVVSTGMSDMEDVLTVYKLLKRRREKAGNNFVLLQCTSSYPTPPEAANLSVIKTYKKIFPDIHIGYSGHEENFILSLGAVALGARVIERHFTLDNSMKGSDHKCSLSVESFAEMVRSIRVLEMGLGSPHKMFQKCEKECHAKLGKSIVAARRISKGQVIAEEDLCVKVGSPIGLCPLKLKELIGKEALTSLDVDETITKDDITF